MPYCFPWKPTASPEVERDAHSAGADENGGVQNEEDLAWADERWWCGTPDQRCRFCGKLVSFAPDSLQIDRCLCDRAPTLMRTIRVRMARAVRFEVALRHASAANRTPARSSARRSVCSEQVNISPCKISGRNSFSAERGLPLAGSDGSPAPRVQRLRVLHVPPSNFDSPTVEKPTGSLAVGGVNVGNHM